MAKIIKYWNVMVADKYILERGSDQFCLGKSKTHKPIIEHGFLMYENHNGYQAGINLSEIVNFSLEPVFEE